jgi:cob(I)alamin adenosyltransferase
MEAQLPTLKSFVLPGGTRLSALFHFARTVCRRAERDLVTLNRAEPVRPVVLQYLNRFSDYLFIVARYMNLVEKVSDVPWLAPSLPVEQK